jgi:GTP-binding protein Era
MGKSTLMNALLQEELCIATSRPQTTRHAILGLLSTPSSQVCLVDTPGVIEQPAYKLQQGMMEAVVGAFNDADVLLVVTDVYSTPIPSDTLFARVQQTSKPVVVVINKVDLLEKNGKDGNVTDTSLSLSAEETDNEYKVPGVEPTKTVEEAVLRWRQLLPEAFAIIPVVASEGPNQVGVQAVGHLLTAHPNVDATFRALGRPIPGMFRDPSKLFLRQEEVSPLLPVSPPLYDTEILTDRTERFIASEMIRAALFETLRKEVPYCCEVRLQSFKEQPENNSLRIEATILVERDSQKAIVIGKSGSVIKDIRVKAQTSIQDFFETTVDLALLVRVDKNWRQNEQKLLEYGYMKPKKKKKVKKG